MAWSPADGRPGRPATGVRFLIVTCAHHGEDARIVHRQARSLLAAGHHVTLVSPAPGRTDVDPPGLVRVAIPRAEGRRRLHAWRAARAAVRARVGEADLLLFHDPELVVALARRRWGVPVVWDIHEDYLAHVDDALWIPALLKPLMRVPVRLIEWWAKRRCHLLLAEEGYTRRIGPYPVVPNSTWVPDTAAPAGTDEPARVVYVGRVSVDRGLDELIELGSLLRGRAVVEIVGGADAEVRERLQAAHDAGLVRWSGFLPNPEAMARLAGALAGLSLLHDVPNYTVSRPTKLLEYLAHGLPVVTTALPLAAQMVIGSNAGAVVRFDHAAADAAVVIDRWIADRALVQQMGAAGHSYVLVHQSWQADSQQFVATLTTWASAPRR
jgi:glycosyltransferase involved in cell wall biosynthesis